MNTFEWALRYLKRGWSVVPVLPKRKTPCVNWTPYQSRLPRPRNFGVGFQSGQTPVSVLSPDR